MRKEQWMWSSIMLRIKNENERGKQNPSYYLYCLFLSFCFDCLWAYGNQHLLLNYSEAKVYQYEMVREDLKLI